MRGVEESQYQWVGRLKALLSQADIEDALSDTEDWSDWDSELQPERPCPCCGRIVPGSQDQGEPQSDGIPSGETE